MCTSDSVSRSNVVFEVLKSLINNKDYECDNTSVNSAILCDAVESDSTGDSIGFANDICDFIVLCPCLYVHVFIHIFVTLFCFSLGQNLFDSQVLHSFSICWIHGHWCISIWCVNCNKELACFIHLRRIGCFWSSGKLSRPTLRSVCRQTHPWICTLFCVRQSERCIELSKTHSQL